ncbi:MAG: hypothetical protein R2710_05720 [Acidimicrobiales bacterium]
MSLAPVMDIGSTDEAQRRVYRLQVLHQLSLAEFGTFGNDHDHLDRHAAPRHPLIVDSDVAEAAAAIVVLLEHLRVTEAVRAFYPGARHDLDDLLALALAEAENDSVAAGEHDVADALRRCCLGGTALAGAPATTSLDPVLLATIDAHIDPLRSPAATLDDSAATAVELATLLLSPSAPTRPSDGEPFVPRVDDPDEADAEIEFPRSRRHQHESATARRRGRSHQRRPRGLDQSSPITIAAELEALERSTAAEPADLRGPIGAASTPMTAPSCTTSGTTSNARTNARGAGSSSGDWSARIPDSSMRSEIAMPTSDARSVASSPCFDRRNGSGSTAVTTATSSISTP